jgi:hypothetical protein
MAVPSKKGLMKIWEFIAGNTGRWACSVSFLGEYLSSKRASGLEDPVQKTPLVEFLSSEMLQDDDLEGLFSTSCNCLFIFRYVCA